MDSVRVRFAPSPTGPLHVGGARTALFNFLFARKHQGSFILRIDDTDTERSEQRYEQDILSSLRWLGISWDEGPDCGGTQSKYRQSERSQLYRATAQRLLDVGGAFRDGEGALRLSYPKKEILVSDLVCGECRFAPDALGPEPVLERSDGSATYHLASVADDIDMQISHIIRGQDHLTNSAKHVVLFQALGARLPVFAHLPLILGEDRTKLSKRNSEGLTSVGDFRVAGYHSEALVNFLMLLGWSHPAAREQLRLEDVVPVFDLARVSTTAAVFERRRLQFLNGYWMRHLPVSLVAERSAEFLGVWRETVTARGSDYWPRAIERLREGVSLLTEAESIGMLLCAEEVPVAEESVAALGGVAAVRPVLDSWLRVLEEFPPADGAECYTEAEFSQLVSLVKKQCKLSGPALFKPLRLAITGLTSGHELKVLIPFVLQRDLRSRAKRIVESLG